MSGIGVTRELRKLRTDPAYALAAAKISQRIQEERGTEVACNALERLLVTDNGAQWQP